MKSYLCIQTRSKWKVHVLFSHHGCRTVFCKSACYKQNKLIGSSWWPVGLPLPCALYRSCENSLCLSICLGIFNKPVCVSSVCVSPIFSFASMTHILSLSLCKSFHSFPFLFICLKRNKKHSWQIIKSIRSIAWLNVLWVVFGRIKEPWKYSTKPNWN